MTIDGFEIDRDARTARSVTEGHVYWFYRYPDNRDLTGPASYNENRSASVPAGDLATAATRAFRKALGLEPVPDIPVGRPMFVLYDDILEPGAPLHEAQCWDEEEAAGVFCRFLKLDLALDGVLQTKYHFRMLNDRENIWVLHQRA